MSTDAPKTIQIFLPSGDPRGIRVAEITTRIVRVIEVPRSLIGDFLKMPEAQQVGLYFLVGQSEDEEAQPSLYVGQSGSISARLTNHQQRKEFRDRALVVVSLTNNLTQTHTLYLEWRAIKEAVDAGRYSLENGNAGARPRTPAPLEADCQEIFDTARVLLATLGHPVFEPLTGSSARTKPDELFYCKASEANGVGVHTDEGFVVLKGSTGRKANVPSIQGTAGERLRQRLIDNGVMKIEGDRVVFQRDYLFRSPSIAALSLMGRTANGWIDWRSADGRTLNEVKRQVSSAAAI